MVLPLAYLCDEDGTPVPWNETRWCDDEFEEILLKAQGTLDVEERRKLMCDIQTIQRDRGSVGIAYWRNRWIAHSPKIKGLKAHPTDYNDIFVHAWVDESA
jgi:peptide/nickel transport system substrate-binding protein